MTPRPTALIALVLAVLPGPVAAQDDSRVVVARAVSPTATFSTRPSNGNQFRNVEENGSIYSTDLVVTLPGGTLVSKSGSVEIQSLPDYDSRSPLPILETALSLANPRGVDLDLTLDRGRIVIKNAKPSGSATARIQFADQKWKVELESPGSRVAIEYCGRWPSGARFKLADPDAPASAAPVASLVLLVLQGSASVDVGGVTLALRAPPGPAELRWDSLAGARPQPLKREKLPQWADSDAVLSPAGQKTAAAYEKFRKARAVDPAKAIQSFLGSKDPTEQRIALATLGGLDQLELLGKSLVEAKTLEEWDFGITVLRHWLGRCKGQDQRYYQVLTTKRSYTPEQAKTIIQLLFGFSAEDLAMPETYGVLIDYLVHDKPAIRNLAAWHLVRLVPQGKAIAYQPDGTREDAERACAQWKKLIPSGMLPPSSKMK